MSYTSKSFSLLIFICVLPFLCSAQKEGIHERGMMKNRTNVERESSDYTIGIVKDTTRFRNSLMKFVTTTVDDAAAETEDDILIQSFGNTSIHRARRDFSNLNEAINLPLVDNKTKKYFSFPCETFKVTSHFGPRRRRYHYGIDLGLKVGEPIKAMFDGRVRIARRAGAYGNLIVVEHYNKLETYYGHLSEINVSENQLVKAGEVLGLGGSTGRSTGPHLHLEVRYEGAAINPEDVINFGNSSLLASNLELTKDNFRHHSIRQNSTRLAKSHGSTSKSGKAYKKSYKNKSLAKKKNTKGKKLAKNSKKKGSKKRR